VRITIGLNVVVFGLVAGFIGGCSSGNFPSSGDGIALKASLAQSIQVEHRFKHTLSVALPTGLRARFASLVPLERSPRAFAMSTPPPACRTYGADASVACQIVTCSPASNICDVYTTTGTLIGLRSGFDEPQGVAADRHGNSYIANTVASTVLEFNRGFSILEATYQDPAEYPVDVSVFPARSVLAAGNIESVSGGPGSVSVYAAGSTTPTSILTDPSVGFAQGIAVAFDRGGDCFWSLNDLNTEQGQIDEFHRCAGSPQKVVSGLGFAGGVAFDSLGNLYYTDQLAGTLFKCTGTTSCTTLTSGFVDPIMINFDDRLRFLWLVDYGAALVDAVDTTSGGVVASFSAGGASTPPVGVAHVPGPPY